MPRRLWTPVRIAELRQLWSAGQTAAAIGQALGGITRSAVLGKVFRLRLAPSAHQRAAPRAGEAAPARRRAGKPPPQPVKPRRKTLLDLTNECCRWPYGERTSRTDGRRAIGRRRWQRHLGRCWRGYRHKSQLAVRCRPRRGRIFGQPHKSLLRTPSRTARPQSINCRAPVRPRPSGGFLLCSRRHRSVQRRA